MHLNALPEAMDGHGAKVAIVDSGAAARTHPDLQEIRTGRDITQDPPNDLTWTDDTVAHGSHCAGIVAGFVGGPGIRGFAPKAEVHVIKIFPGGRFSSLLDALDYCVANDIDIVNMSLGSGQSSDLLLQKISQAKQHGVACVVAAGNSGDQVQFPGTSPDVLTVAAMGKPGEYPPDSFHAQQVWSPDGHGPTGEDYFSAKFSCFGPEVDVCAPGVAVMSSVPPDGFGAWDGTSMAAPHVTGLAALLIAHHPDFAGPFAARNAQRVEHLFGIIKQSCAPLDVGDPNRTGAGIPDAVQALRGGPAPAVAPRKPPDPAIEQALAQLEVRMMAIGLATGPSYAPPPQPDPRIAQLREQMIALGLLPANR
jgi:subtilisin family serine protease